METRNLAFHFLCDCDAFTELLHSLLADKIRPTAEPPSARLKMTTRNLIFDLFTQLEVLVCCVNGRRCDRQPIAIVDLSSETKTGPKYCRLMSSYWLFKARRKVGISRKVEARKAQVRQWRPPIKKIPFRLGNYRQFLVLRFIAVLTLCSFQGRQNGEGKSCCPKEFRQWIQNLKLYP